jgi:hypothetical protein
MSWTVEQETAEIGVRLLDDAHVAWSAAQNECENALHHWFDASPRDRDAMYFRYRAALDREEAAALDFKRLWELSQPCRTRLTQRETSQ